MQVNKYYELKEGTKSRFDWQMAAMEELASQHKLLSTKQILQKIKNGAIKPETMCLLCARHFLSMKKHFCHCITRLETLASQIKEKLDMEQEMALLSNKNCIMHKEDPKKKITKLDKSIMKEIMFILEIKTEFLDESIILLQECVKKCEAKNKEEMVIDIEKE